MREQEYINLQHIKHPKEFQKVPFSPLTKQNWT